MKIQGAEYFVATVFIISALLSQVESRCTFAQFCQRDPSSPWSKCPDANNATIPIPWDEEPRMNNATVLKTMEKVCPNYVGELTCCNDDQVAVMDANFGSIDALFGYCPLCAMNLKQFWCNFTCDKNQSLANVYDHTGTTTDGYDVIFLNITVNPQVSCDLWDSCKKIPFASQVATSADAFLQFMGINAKTTGKTYINIDLKDEPNAIYTESVPCQQTNNGTVHKYDKVGNCTCTYCEQLCNVAEAPPFPAFFDGFNWLAVVIVYAALIVISLVIILIKYKCGKKRTRGEQVSSESRISNVY